VRELNKEEKRGGDCLKAQREVGPSASTKVMHQERREEGKR